MAGYAPVLQCGRFAYSENLHPLLACGLVGIEAVDRDPNVASIRRDRQPSGAIGGKRNRQIGNSENACPFVESSVRMWLSSVFLEEIPRTITSLRQHG